MVKIVKLNMIENMSPKVSVVMSCYNSGVYLKESIESILNQTFTDFEFIIWNDGSTDLTEEIVMSYNDSRIRYFYHENTGLGQALNLACREARGEYIARMDADDIALNNRLEVEVDFLERNKEYILVSSAVNYIDEYGNRIGRTFPYTWDVIIRGIIYKSSLIVHPAVMYRKDAYFSTGGYLNIGGAEDIILWGRMKNKGKFSNIKMPLLNYRILSTSLSHFTIGSSYLPLLNTLRLKISNSCVIDNDDILLHNYIFALIKRKCTKDSQLKQIQIVQTGIVDSIYPIISKLLGHQKALNSIIFFKNLFGLIKYSKLIYFSLIKK